MLKTPLSIIAWLAQNFARAAAAILSLSPCGRGWPRSGRVRRAALAGFLALVVSSPASAHDTWANGEPVPPWVKRACCGPEDAHHLKPEEVHQSAAGWRVDGYNGIIPNGTELPSPDGSYWIFYRIYSDGSQTNVYCFFVPVPST